MSGVVSEPWLREQGISLRHHRSDRCCSKLVHTRIWRNEFLARASPTPRQAFGPFAKIAVVGERTFTVLLILIDLVFFWGGKITSEEQESPAIPLTSKISFVPPICWIPLVFFCSEKKKSTHTNMVSGEKRAAYFKRYNQPIQCFNKAAQMGAWGSLFKSLQCCERFSYKRGKCCTEHKKSCKSNRELLAGEEKNFMLPQTSPRGQGRRRLMLL